MPDIYFDPGKVLQRTDELQDELRHVRQFLQLIRRCQASDLQHKQELSRIRKRLEDMERYLTKLIAVLQDAVVRYQQLCGSTQTSFAAERSAVEHLFV